LSTTDHGEFKTPSKVQLSEFLFGAENADELSFGYQRFFHDAAWL